MTNMCISYVYQATPLLDTFVIPAVLQYYYLSSSAMPVLTTFVRMGYVIDNRYCMSSALLAYG